MLVYRYPKLLISFIVAFIFLLSCDDANYQLDNEFDPENLGLSSPTIFFHPPEFESIKVDSSSSFELYSYEVQNAAGAHLQIEFDSEIIPNTTAIISTYPNPFNPSTKVEIYLNESQDIILSVYDINGKLVKTLADEQLHLGQHYFTWSPENLSSGVYIVSLKTNLDVTTNKILYLK